MASAGRIVEFVTDKILFWFPFYDEFKVCGWVWLSQYSGHKWIYSTYIKPWLALNEIRIDTVLKRFRRIGGEFGAVQVDIIKQFAVRLLYQV